MSRQANDNRSPTYALFARAMAERKQIVCVYDGCRRELCPIILGHSKGQEVALVYQFAGDSRSRVPDWKCLRLAMATAVELREGPWRQDSGHHKRQTCVEIVDVDVNSPSPYRPRRRLKP